MALSLDALAKIHQDNASDGWRAWGRMETLTRDEPAGTLQELVWRAQREGRLDLGGYQNQWRSLAQDYSGFGAQDVLTLLKSIHAHFSRLDGSNQTAWGDGELEGWPSNFSSLFDAKRDDPDFYTQLAQEWSTLPAPYDRGLATRLAQQGALGWQELPTALIDHHARVMLRKGRLGDRQWNTNVWPQNLWRDAIVRALSDPALVIEQAHHIYDLFEFATPEQLVQAIARVQKSTGRGMDLSADILDQSSALIQALHDALAALEPEQLTVREHREADPGFYLLTCYLSACRALGQPPAADIDPQLSAFITAYEPGWSGGGFEEFHQELRQLLGVIPRERLERMLMASTSTSLVLLCGACPTDAVSAHLVETIAATPYQGVHSPFSNHAWPALAAMGEAAVPHALTALRGDGGGAYRNLLMSLLTHHPEHELALQLLLENLDDRDQHTRSSAVRGLSQVAPERVLERVGEVLSARRKDSREAAATVLLSLPPSARGYELAQARLKHEKTSAVKSLLERVEPGEAAAPDAEPGAALGGQQVDALAQAIQAGEPGCWREHEALGEALLAVFMRIWSEETGAGHVSYLEDGRTRYEPATSWVELLSTLGAESEAGLEQAVSLAGALSMYWYEDYFERLHKIYGPQRVGEQLAERLSEGQFLRPPGFQPHAYEKPSQVAGARFLLSQYPAHAAVAVKIMLEDKTKTAREDAVRFVVEHAALFSADMFTSMLQSRRKDVRLTVAQLLGELGDAGALGALEAAAKREKTPAVAAAIQEAIVILSSAAFEVGRFPSTPAGELELDAALAMLPKVSEPALLVSRASELPAPCWQLAQQPMSQQALDWLLCELSRESMEHHGEDVVAVCERLEQEDLFALCEEILERAHARDKDWPLFMQGVIGSPACIEETGRHLEEFAQSQAWGWGDHGVEVMVRRNTLQAVRILDDWQHKSKSSALKSRAQQGVARIALQRDMSVEELLEASISDFGFDAAGEQRFDYGAGRQILVRLGGGDELGYHDEGADKTYKSMPKARQGDDEALVFAARSRVSRIKKELKRLRRNQTRRLEDAMATQRRWVPSSWRERYALHPVMRSFAQGMVWGVYEAKGDEFLYAVHVDASGEVVDLEDETHPLSDDSHRVGVIHPSLLTAREREQWLARFADFEIISGFEQLQRPIHRQQDWPATSAEIAAELEGVHPGTFMGRTEHMGWELGPREDAGLISRSHRTLGPWRVTITHDGFSPQWLEDAPIYITDFAVSRHQQAQELAQLPAPIFSEIVYELSKATRTGEA